jgi:O-antigen biosynthesis protein
MKIRAGGARLKRTAKRKSKGSASLRRLHYQSGLHSGYAAGFNAGYDKGYDTGIAEGTALRSVPFEGTSIIIPTYNQCGYLTRCMESIVRHTHVPYELIVVDNASEDGTAEFIASAQIRIRYWRNETNHGFSGAINRGLMMARGTTLLLLNNDTVVSEGWLTNLLACVQSNPRIGLAGPVSNNISGEQLVAVPYTDIDGMHRYAAEHNVGNPALWRSTSRLTGFCMLMRRDVFERLGYMDESFRIGNCEDDDYGYRARLLGYELMIAGDTIVHHEGSVSIKKLGGQFDEIYGANMTYLVEKWSDPAGLLQTGEAVYGLSGASYYPQLVEVRGAGDQPYWIAQGTRRPIVGETGLSRLRISQVELCQWPLGEPIPAEQCVAQLALAEAWAGERHPLPEGCLVRGPAGTIAQIEGGLARSFINDRALSSWGMENRTIFALMQETWEGLPPGLPIVARNDVGGSGV